MYNNTRQVQSYKKTTGSLQMEINSLREKNYFFSGPGIKSDKSSGFTDLEVVEKTPIEQPAVHTQRKKVNHWNTLSNIKALPDLL